MKETGLKKESTTTSTCSRSKNKSPVLTMQNFRHTVLVYNICWKFKAARTTSSCKGWPKRYLHRKSFNNFMITVILYLNTGK